MLTTTTPEHLAPDAPRILIIDDSKLARANIRIVLEGEFHILEGVDGEEGWRILSTDERIQVVITDAQMPVLDGFGLLTRIRQSSIAWIKHIPVIMVTGVEEQTARAQALDAGVTDFFTKPVYKTQLVAKVRSLARLDQTTRKLLKASSALAEQGAIDPITNVNSRRYFLERVAQDLAYSKRHAQNLSAIFLEADDYHNVLQYLGEETAHSLLIWLAQHLKETVRTEDTITRIQDSRFAITMTNSGRLEAAVLGDRLRKLITSVEFVHKGVSKAVTVSVCLVCAGRDPVQSAEDFLHIADQRLVRARSEGGNRMVSSDAPEAVVEETITGLLANLDSILTDSARDGEKLKPHLMKLAQRALLILDLANNNLNLGIAEGIRYIRAKLGRNNGN